LNWQEIRHEKSCLLHRAIAKKGDIFVISAFSGDNERGVIVKSVILAVGQQ
jgi:hypothetical protein